jgi:metallo-beta-lactamase family protein
VHTIGGYSAHADQKGLVRFVTRMTHWPSEIRIVHGEPRAKALLAEFLRKCYQAQGQCVSVAVPE